MRPMQLLAIGLTVGTVPATVAVQFFGLQLLVRVLDRLRRGSVRMLVAIPWIMVLHFVQIGLYAADVLVAETASIYPASTQPTILHGIDAIYFSGETFTAVGHGDYAPVGLLRLVSSIETLNGLLLIGWSVTFVMRVRQNNALMRS